MEEIKMSKFVSECTSGCHDGVIFNTSDGEIEFESVTCGGGDASCYVARLLSPLDAEYREFHPERLRHATDKINGILKELMNDDQARNGKHLAFISVPGGMMLNWVSFGDLPSN